MRIPVPAVVLFGFVAVAILVGSSLFYRTQEVQLRQKADDEVRAVVELDAKQIQNWRAERLGDAGIVSYSPLVAQNIAGWLANPNGNETEQILLHFRQLQNQYHYSDIMVVDVDGRVLLSLSGRHNTIAGEAKGLLEAALRDQAPMLSALLLYPGETAPYMFAIAPVNARQGDRRVSVGAVVLEVDAREFLYTVLHSWPLPRHSYETLLVLRAGEDFLVLNDLRRQSDTAFRLKVPRSTVIEPVATGAQNGEGVYEGRDYRGVEVFSAIVSVPGSPWLLIAELDATEALSTLRFQTRLIIALVVLMLSAVGGGVALFHQRMQRDHFRAAYEAEVALRKSEARYRTLFESAGDAILIIRDGRIVDCNPSTLQLFRCRMEDIVGEAPEGRFSPARQPDGRDSFEKAKEKMELVLGGLPQNFEWRHRRIDGTEFDTEVSLNLLELDAHPAILAIVRDITERKKVSEALQAVVKATAGGGEAFFSALVSQLAEVLGVKYALVGVLPPETPGMIRTVSVWAKGEIAPNFEYPMASSPCANLFSRSICYYPDGVQNRFPEDKSLADMGVASYMGIPLFSASGDPLGFLAVMNDRKMENSDLARSLLSIFAGRAAGEVDRKQVEDALRESEEKFFVAFNHAPVMAAISEMEDATLLDVNDKYVEVSGFTREELLGKTPVEIGWLRAEERMRLLEALHDKGNLSDIESTRYTKSGTPVQCIYYIEVVTIGGVKRLLTMALDITERKQAEKEIQRLLAKVREDAAELEKRVAERTAQLKEANEELEAFAYSVSHDLKAPLRGIDGYSRLLLEDHAPKLDEEGRFFVETIRTATGQMGQLLDDLLAYSRLERRKMKADSFQLRSFVDELLVVFLGEVRSRGVTLKSSVPETFVQCDAEGLKLAFRNVMENALKFTREIPSPIVELGAYETDDSLVVWVRDNGIGFDMKYHDRIFEIFHRLQRSEDYPGTGIGLALVYKAMKRLGGRVWAESKPREGATFFLEIPR